MSARYTTMGLNSAPHGALLRLFGGASDAAPMARAPDVVLPATLALSLLALLTLAKLEPEAGPVALVVALPAVWYYAAVLTLPQVVTLLRSSKSRLAALLATAALAAAAAPVGAAERSVVWSVRGEQNTVYLFGSIHVLRPADVGLPGAAQAAYDDAEQVVMEIDMLSSSLFFIFSSLSSLF